MSDHCGLETSHYKNLDICSVFTIEFQGNKQIRKRLPWQELCHMKKSRY